MATADLRTDFSGLRFDRLRIPARCPHCAAIHNFYYLWLRNAGGFQCPRCRLAVMMDLDGVDAAMDGVGAAVDTLSRAIGRLALAAWQTEQAAKNPAAKDPGTKRPGASDFLEPQPHPSPPSIWDRGG